jgi:DNA-binding MarR family transcriptional regulator
MQTPFTSRNYDSLEVHVSEIVGTGAHLSPAQLRVWTAVLDTSRILDTELEAALEPHGMKHREYEVLVRVDGAGGRLRMSVLARQIEASAALISQTITKLEARDWVVREASDVDGRGVDAVLTTRGRTALAAAAGPHAQLIRTLLLDPLNDELTLVADALGGVAAHLRAHRSGARCDEPDCPMNS